MPITDQDLWLFNEGRHADLHRHLGVHELPNGTHEFTVWAPDAQRVQVVGDFNSWDGSNSELFPVGASGVWRAHIANAEPWQRYKFRLLPRAGGEWLEKSDPFGRLHESAPATASIISETTHAWNDQAWRRRQARTNPWNSPVSIYEVHLGSWRHGLGDGPLYRAIAEPLARYCQTMGFTHVELMPVMEHPFYGSWGYQVTGYFAPSSRYGNVDDLKFLIDALHGHGVGVILDWVPAHFPNDPHGLAEFDGTHLYEHADPRKGWHPDWNTCIFNFGRNEVRSFLLSSALFWLDEFHADGLRVDAVASMLYLDYSREDGAWIPNAQGGNENLEAISLMQVINETVYARHPHALMIAEESTAWAGVSRPTKDGGLGFGFKWDMGWMHDTLQYLARDPVHRTFHHDEITFRSVYAFSENFVLALSHDEVVHGKGSIPRKMPGDDWQRYANVRILFGCQTAQPGKKLLFMGMEFAQWDEWSHEAALQWGLLDVPKHEGVRRWVADLNSLYARKPALYRNDVRPEGVDWGGLGDGREESVITIIRLGNAGDPPIVAVANFTPTVREGYRVGVPWLGRWREALNSDDTTYGGTGVHTPGRPMAEPVSRHGQSASVLVNLPPLSVVFFEPWGYRLPEAP